MVMTIVVGGASSWWISSHSGGTQMQRKGFIFPFKLLLYAHFIYSALEETLTWPLLAQSAGTAEYTDCISAKG